MIKRSLIFWTLLKICIGIMVLGVIKNPIHNNNKFCDKPTPNRELTIQNRTYQATQSWKNIVDGKNDFKNRNPASELERNGTQMLETGLPVTTEKEREWTVVGGQLFIVFPFIKDESHWRWWWFLSIQFLQRKRKRETKKLQRKCERGI